MWGRAAFRKPKPPYTRPLAPIRMTGWFCVLHGDLFVVISKFHLERNLPNRATLKTLKPYYIALGAWRVNHANKQVLKISLPAKKRHWMGGIFAQIQNISPPFNYSNS